MNVSQARTGNMQCVLLRDLMQHVLPAFEKRRAITTTQCEMV
ncbi:hypothetical protein [Limnohabitans sp. Rim8]